MTLRTLGTNATTSLSGFVVGLNDPIAADLAAISVAIKADPPSWNAAPKGTFRAQVNQAYVKKGRLIIPKRGELVLVDGDFVCWDATTGWPIVVSADAAANGPYTHT
jgi:hypothetical protein